MKLPYSSSTAGQAALADLEKVLDRFGCKAFGTMTDAEKGTTIVQFRWRSREVMLEASWKGYATAWLKENPLHVNHRRTRAEHEAVALAQARISVCSVLRDWVKGQVTAIECGVMSFETAFLPHMLLPSGQRITDFIVHEKLLPAQAGT